MQRKHTPTCISKSGRTRRTYARCAEAMSGARYAMRRYGDEMIPYRCDLCGTWHLCPAERHTPSEMCKVCPKQSYKTEAAAKLRGQILREERGVELHVYACPHTDGWHLTSMAPGTWKPEDD